MTIRVCQFLLTAIIACLPMMAQGSDDAAAHEHKPMLVRSRPVIERLPLQVIQPVDVTITEFGDTLVADEIGKVVFRMDSDGESNVIGEKLQGISRICDSRLTETHVLLKQPTSGQIVRLTDGGSQSVVSELPFAPVGLGVDSTGNLWTTNGRAGTVILVTASGKSSVLTKLSESPVDIAVDDLGAAVLLKSGKVVSVTSSGATKTIGYVPASSSRLKAYGDGTFVALSQDDKGRSILVRPSTDRKTVDRFAGTPMGTSAFAFDQLGNLTLANPDLRAITRVTSHFKVPCPHCGKLTDMILSADAPLHSPKKRRSF